MIPQTISITPDKSLRCYGRESDPTIIKYAAPVNEYCIFENSQTIGGYSYEWNIEDDCEILNGWFSTKFDGNFISFSSNIIILVFDGTNLIYQINRTFEQIGASNSDGNGVFWELPKGFILRKGLRLKVSVNTGTDGFKLLGTSCHIFNPIAATAIGL